MGSTWLARRTVCSPAISVASSGRPWAVLQTACTMFPRSYRANWKSSYLDHTMAKRTSDQPVIAE